MHLPEFLDPLCVWGTSSIDRRSRPAGSQELRAKGGEGIHARLEERRRLSKGRIALELLDRARADGLPEQVLVADAGYGISGPFCDSLAERGLHDIVGVADDMVVFAAEPVWESPGRSAGPGPGDAREHGPAWPRTRPGRRV
ncbi:MAG: hypothetical protein ABS79_01145 [Planctomycetes bacterium SCN 63-9]|nr:MAG: hypothetical protein ABS79_01145 [Planctomycetes bacterium SCN 63-9]